MNTACSSAKSQIVAPNASQRSRSSRCAPVAKPEADERGEPEQRLERERAGEQVGLAAVRRRGRAAPCRARGRSPRGRRGAARGRPSRRPPGRGSRARPLGERCGGDQQRGDQPSADAAHASARPRRGAVERGRDGERERGRDGDEEPGEEVEVEPAPLDAEADEGEHGDDHGDEHAQRCRGTGAGSEARTGREAPGSRESPSARPRAGRRGRARHAPRRGRSRVRSAYLSCRQAARCR